MESIGDIVEAAAEENEESSGDFSDFMAGIEQNMLHFMKESAKAPETAYEHWQAFSSAVDWSESWICGLLSFHFVLFTIVIVTRKSENAQILLFLLVCSMAFLSERLNTFCAENWMQFSKQNYFDEHGVFAGIMYSGPLLFIGLIQLVNFLVLSSSALIKAKRLELAQQQNNKKSKGGEDNSKKAGGTDDSSKKKK